jgi:hypothetical protein
MFKKLSTNPIRKQEYTSLIALICMLALGLSACEGFPSSSLTPTPSTLTSSLLSEGQSNAESTAEATAVSTEMSGSNNGQEEDLVDICALITQPEAEAVLGQPVTSVSPGVDQDSVTGGTLYFCSYLGTGLTVVIALVDAGSAVDAKQIMEQQLAKMLADDASTTSTQDDGLGDQAYWTTTEHAAQYTAVKDGYLFSVLLGGNIGDPEAHRAALLNLAKSMASRL